MGKPAEGEITRILRVLADKEGDQATATAQLFQAAYRELHRVASNLMRKERQGHTFQTTDLIDETYLHLVGDSPVTWESRAQFFGVVASAMRRVLVEHARKRSAEKRGGGWKKIMLDKVQLAGRSEFEILELDRVLSLFAEADPRAARVVEMRVFGGLREKEIAEILGISERTVRDDWRMATMWLGRELGGTPSP